MNKDQVKGRVTEAAGKVKEAFGKMTGNKQTQVAGTLKKDLGKTQAAYGDVKADIKKAE
ncbi:CsbD family protein [Cupriavidus sp. IDO]|uniref:CsbD family protein n=1 Tax=Cupriavidus sp. IDO TaxID=1539142 RepID=UPI000579274E|nr:CsbD family protein [Cupriavidus sp. IDO]KWR91334.1 general stress protein CsbD [Cupriavidus sp. IDO]KWR91351.1 general stress protein CsbD [Cupriavidus sp. IDO]